MYLYCLYIWLMVFNHSKNIWVNLVIIQKVAQKQPHKITRYRLSCLSIWPQKNNKWSNGTQLFFSVEARMLCANPTMPTLGARAEHQKCQSWNPGAARLVCNTTGSHGGVILSKTCINTAWYLQCFRHFRVFFFGGFLSFFIGFLLFALVFSCALVFLRYPLVRVPSCSACLTKDASRKIVYQNCVNIHLCACTTKQARLFAKKISTHMKSDTRHTAGPINLYIYHKQKTRNHTNNRNLWTTHSHRNLWNNVPLITKGTKPEKQDSKNKPHLTWPFNEKGSDTATKPISNHQAVAFLLTCCAFKFKGACRDGWEMMRQQLSSLVSNWHA